MARDSVATVEQVLVALHTEINHDRDFIVSMLAHKNDMIGWIRKTQAIEVKAVSDMFDAVVDNLKQEIEFFEKHLATYDKGVDGGTT